MHARLVCQRCSGVADTHPDHPHVGQVFQCSKQASVLLSVRILQDNHRRVSPHVLAAAAPRGMDGHGTKQQRVERTSEATRA